MTTTKPIRLAFAPVDLLTAFAVTDKFRANDESRPILEAVHVRYEPGSTTHVQFTATDSYHLVRVTLELAGKHRVSKLLEDGVMIRARTADVRRLAQAVTRGTNAHKAQQQRVRVKDRQPLDPTTLVLTITPDPEPSSFGFTPDGSWNGGGMFIAADGPLAAGIDLIATGNRVAGEYVNVDALLESRVAGRVELTERVAVNPEYLADVAAAAAVFARCVEPGAPWRHALILDSATGPLDVMRFTTDQHKYTESSARFLALLNPIRLQSSEAPT